MKSSLLLLRPWPPLTDADDPPASKRERRMLKNRPRRPPLGRTSLPRPLLDAAAAAALALAALALTERDSGAELSTRVGDAPRRRASSSLKLALCPKWLL